MKTIKYDQNGVEVDIKFDDDNKDIWMNQTDIAALYKTDKQNINYHFKNIFNEKELINQATVKEILTVRYEGKRKVSRPLLHYNLEVIKQIGYKINPSFTNDFIRWVEDELQRQQSQNIPIESNIIRFSNGSVELDVKFVPSESTILLSKDQLIKLFDTTRQNIEYHIDNIYSSNELERGATCKEILQVQNEGGREVNRVYTLYNLDMVISLGYRINTKRGIEFRMWATKILNEYLRKGYAVNENRVTVTIENYLNLVHKINSIDARVEKLEKENNIKVPISKIFYENKEYDAKAFILSILESANKEVVIIDPYCDYRTLSIISNKRENINLALITSNTKKLTNKELGDYLKENSTISLYIDDRFHDRFIVIDNVVFYEIGGSINYIGRKLSILKKAEDEAVIKMLKERITEIKHSATNI